MNLDLSVWLNRSLFPKGLCAFFGLLLLGVLVQAKSVLWVPTSPSVIAVVNIQPAINVQKMLEIPLFGQYFAVDGTGPIKPSTLSVELAGVLYSSKPAESQVLIRLNSGEEQSYSMGQELPGGAIIKRIKADSVFILYQGNLEILTLPKKPLQFVEPEKPLLERP